MMQGGDKEKKRKKDPKKKHMRGDSASSNKDLLKNDSPDEDAMSSQINSFMQMHNASVAQQISANNNEFANMKNLDDLIQKLTTKLCKPEDMLIHRGNPST